MPDLVLEILKYAFLVILYIFISRAIRATYVELQPTGGGPAPSAQRSPQRKTKKVPRKAAVTQGPKKGESYDLKEELIIGRGDKCQIVLDDTYVSQVHARIFSRGDSFLVEDLGSTNGTYLNRKRITAPIELQRGDEVKIGKTVLEMRK
jgi:pSer/pThr/pTyr-binding forkhead associated (FHA) protein